MSIPATIRIGVRSTKLASAIAHEVHEALQQAHPHLAIELVMLGGAGDHVHDGPAAKGGFTSDLDKALTDGRIDVALHDMADLPAVRPDAFALAAVPKRRHPFDVLLTLDGRILDELEEGEKIGASTASRRAQMLAYREDLEVVPAKGSLDVHRKQLEDGVFQGLVMAAADAERLGWHDRVSEIFTTEVCIPAPGQGALALETLATRKDIVSALKPLEDRACRAAVLAERAWLNELGGEDDDLPAGALANIVEDRLVVEAVIVSPDGMEVVRDEIDGPTSSAEMLGAKLAVRMLERGGREIVEALTDRAE